MSRRHARSKFVLFDDDDDDDDEKEEEGGKEDLGDEETPRNHQQQRRRGEKEEEEEEEEDDGKESGDEEEKEEVEKESFENIGEDYDDEKVYIEFEDDEEIASKEEWFGKRSAKEETETLVSFSKREIQTIGIPFQYDERRRLVLPTMGSKAGDKAVEKRGKQIWDEKIKDLLEEELPPFDVGSIKNGKFTKFDADRQTLVSDFKERLDNEEIIWPARNPTHRVADTTLHKYCDAFLRTLKLGSENNTACLSTEPLYDLRKFLERIFCARDSAAGSLSIELVSILRVMEKHPEIPLGEDDENTLLRQHKALGKVINVVMRCCAEIGNSRFESDVLEFDYDDLLDAIVKIYDGKWALEERQLICEFGSRSELRSMVLVHNPKEGVVEALLKEGHSVIVIESKISIDKKSEYSDVNIALPEGLKIGLKKRRFTKKVEETIIFETNTGEEDQTIARILVGIFATETKQQSPTAVVHLLQALDNRGFDGKYSWPYRIFRLIQEFGCRDDLGTVQFVCNPKPEQMKELNEARANLVMITTKDGKDLPADVNFLKTDEFLDDVELEFSLFEHKTAGENILTPSRKIESEDVIRMLLDIYHTESNEQEVDAPFFLIPIRNRLVDTRSCVRSIGRFVSDVLKTLQCKGKNLKEISGPQAVTFLRKLLASTLFHNERAVEFKKGADNVEIVNLCNPPTIHGTVLNAHAFKMYHTSLVHLKHYLRLLKKAMRAKVDLTKHLTETQINDIRANWNGYMAKGKDNVIQGRKMYSKADWEIIMEELERAYVGPPPGIMSELQRTERRAKLFEVAESRKYEKIINEETGETKAQLNETIAKKIGRKSMTPAAVKAYVNLNIFETYQIRKQCISELFAEENPSEEALRLQHEIVGRFVDETYFGEQKDKIKKYMHAVRVKYESEKRRRQEDESKWIR